jgi:adenylosuccinate lyase
MEAAKNVKEYGLENDLLSRIVKDDIFKINMDEILSILDPINFIGRAPGQVIDFVENYINPIIEQYKTKLGLDYNLTV